MRSFLELSPADDISFHAGNLKIAHLMHNNGNGGDNSIANDPYSFKTQFNPAVAIVIVVLLSILFFMGVFSIYIRRCIMEDEGPGSSTRVTVHNEEATRGLERTVIESFPVFSYNLVKGLKAEAKSSECAVCLSDFEGHEMLRLLPKCSHAFHPQCIDMWLCSHTTCPLCRTSLLPDPARAVTEVAFVEASTQTPPEQLTIVTDTQVAHNEGAGASQMGHDLAGHSLIRVRKEMEKEMEQPTEWYIATEEGLTAGLRKSCSFQLVQGPSSSMATPLCASLGNAGCRTRSERWGNISVNPASFLRTFSERFVPQSAESKRFSGRTGALN